MVHQVARPCFILATNETGFWTPVGAGGTSYQCLGKCYEEEAVGWQSAKFVIVGAFIPLVALVGLPANVLVTVVYSRPHMRRVAINRFLFCLALSDTGVIVMAVSLFAVNIYKPHVPFLTSIYVNLVHLWYPLANTFQLNSIMLTVSAALHCYYGLREQVYGASNRLPAVRFMIAGSFALSLAFNAVKGFEIAFFKCYSAAKHAAVWDVTAATFRMNETYQFLYYTVATSLIQTLLPLPALVLLARLIIRTSKHPEAGDEAKGDAQNLIAVVILFITCNTPSLAIIFMERLYPPHAHPFMGVVTDVSNALVAVNSSLNFFLYLVFSGSFRSTLGRLLKGVRSGGEIEGDSVEGGPKAFGCRGSAASGKRLHDAGTGHYQYLRVTVDGQGRGQLARRWSPLNPLPPTLSLLTSGGGPSATGDGDLCRDGAELRAKGANGRLPANGSGHQCRRAGACDRHRRQLNGDVKSATPSPDVGQPGERAAPPSTAGVPLLDAEPRPPPSRPPKRPASYAAPRTTGGHKQAGSYDDDYALVHNDTTTTTTAHTHLDSGAGGTLPARLPCAHYEPVIPPQCVQSAARSHRQQRQRRQHRRPLRPPPARAHRDLVAADAVLEVTDWDRRDHMCYYYTYHDGSVGKDRAPVKRTVTFRL